MFRVSSVLWVIVAAASIAACQSPTDPDEVVDFDEVVNVSVSPDPIIADTQTGDRTYRVVRGNNQPDEILPYDWHATFSATVSFNNNATSDDVDIDFPVRLTATTLAVKQASGGIVTPPTGTETEKFEFVTLSATGNQFPGSDSPINLTFEVWYDLPSLRKEAVITATFAFVDNNGASFQKVLDVRVAP